MALKTNFEDAAFLSSPFVDEVANPGTGDEPSLPNDPSSRMLRVRAKKFARRRAGMTDAQKEAQARVNATDKKFGDPKNKNRDMAEGL